MTEQIPMTPKEKLANFWTYHWKLILVILGVAAFVVIGVVSMLVQPNYDTSILVATAGKRIRIDTPVIVALQRKLEEYGRDVNGDGQVRILLDVIDYPSSEFSQSNMAEDVRLTAELQAGDSQLYLFDKTIYERFVEQDHYENPAALFPNYDIPMVTAVPVRDTLLADVSFPLPEEGLAERQTEEDYYADANALLDDLVLVMRTDPGVKEDRRETQLALLQALLDASFQ